MSAKIFENFCDLLLVNSSLIEGLSVEARKDTAPPLSGMDCEIRADLPSQVFPPGNNLKV